MVTESIATTLFLIFTGTAVLATLALYARQSLLVVYILLGIILGPSGISLVTDPVLIQEISHIGIIFLLFLLGINLPPMKFLQLLKETTYVTGVSALLFIILGCAIAWLFGYNVIDSLLIGTALMFSSTIIGIKLLPTTILHHRRRGEIIISILLLQDFLAIIVLLLIQTDANTQSPIFDILMLFLSLLGICLLAFLLQRFVLLKLITRFDKIREYLFLLTIGWCLGIAQLAEYSHLSYEIGAFIAGITLASNPIANYIAEILKPLRDFFLVLFFFSLGATFPMNALNEVLLPAAILAILVISLKPIIYKYLLTKSGESDEEAAEIGVRLGQGSEFSLLIAVLALKLNMISSNAAYLIQLSTLITFAISSYIVVFKYPTPVSLSDKLRRD